MQNNFIVVDLDGTLISTNSFPLWIKFLIIRSLKDYNFCCFFKVAYFIFLRKVLRIEHADFKKRLMNLNIDDEYNIEFVNWLSRHLNGTVVKFLSEVKNPILLSTAAPSSYARHLNLIVDFEILSIHSTEVSESEYFENFSNGKVVKFRKFFKDSNVSLFLTDHFDDMPMMKISERVLLVEPSGLTLRKLQASSVSYSILGGCK